MMIFTSGTSGDPKAVRFAHAMARDLRRQPGRAVRTHCRRCVLPVDAAVPLQRAWRPAGRWRSACGAAMVPAKFSPSRFLSDIRRYGATYMNYVGKPLAYVLATPGAARRCRQHAAGGVRQRGHRTRHRGFRAAIRVPGRRQLRFQRVRRRRQPRRRHTAGLDRQGLSAGVSDLPRRDRRPNARLRFSMTHGALANFDDAVGELVNTYGSGCFLGYYNDPGRHRGSDAPRHVLVRRPRLPRRGRVDLPGRPNRRLAARGRREPRRRARSSGSCNA